MVGSILKTVGKIALKELAKKASRKGTIGAYKAAAKAQRTIKDRAKNELVRYAEDHGHKAKITNKGFKISDEPMDVYKTTKTKPVYKNLGKNISMGRLRKHLGY